jgi:hypothetical protein
MRKKLQAASTCKQFWLSKRMLLIGIYYALPLFTESDSHEKEAASLDNNRILINNSVLW